MAGENYDLSIIILNNNVKDLLLNCLESVFKDPSSKNWQVIVVDNASSDGSVEAVKKQFEIASPSARNDGQAVELVVNKENLGFAEGNNSAIHLIKASTVLFLNPDTVVIGGAISKSLEYLLGNPDIGALTCRVELPNGKVDYSSHRGFPTPWNSFAYFSGLSKLFPKSPIFAGYTASYLDTRTTHEIDCLTGAFLMVRKIAGDAINWWDKDYFWNGEDIEFCFNLKEKGWKILFFSDAKIIHYKGSSSGLWKIADTKVEKSQRLKSATYGVSAMRIFYKKHYYKNYPPILRDLILIGINLLEKYRKAKIWISQ